MTSLFMYVRDVRLDRLKEVRLDKQMHICLLGRFGRINYTHRLALGSEKMFIPKKRRRRKENKMGRTKKEKKASNN